jgi:hypothetical protein
VRSTDRREAEDPAFPRRICKQVSGVETPHAVSDQMNGLFSKRLFDLLSEPLRAPLHTRNRGYSGDDDTISPPSKQVRNSTEIAAQRDPSQADPAKPKQTMSQHKRRINMWTNHGSPTRTSVADRVRCRAFASEGC